MNKHIVIQISGRVQGVWFRQSAKRVAESLNLVGYATNNDDGTVTIEAYGTNEHLEQLIVWCNDGSEMACVDNVEYVIDDKCNKNYKDFNIL